MLNVVCVRTGHKYSVDYVYKLKSMVARHLKQAHNFYCITDNPNQLQGVKTIPAPLQIADSWAKIGLFCPQLQVVENGDKMLFLDLDVIVTGSLDNLIAGKIHPKKPNEDGIPQKNTDLWIVKDWHDPFNSSVMLWEHGSQGRIWGAWKALDMDRLRGDQNFIAEIKPDARLFKQKDILSYKFDHVNDKPKDGKVVLFHGEPKMHQLPNVNWINKEWK